MSDVRDLRDLLNIFCENPVAFTGPRIYSGSGYRIFNAKDGVASIAQDIALYAADRPESRLDVWARKTNNDAVFCPVIDVTMAQGTPPPFERPSGVIAAGGWTTYLYALVQRVPFSEYDRVEALRRRLASLSIPRQEVQEGFLLPGTVHGLAQTTRTQEHMYYSYGPVRVPLSGNVELRTALVHFDGERRVNFSELEAIAPPIDVSRRRLTGAIQMR